MSKGSDPTMAGCTNPKHRIKKLQEHQLDCYNKILCLLDQIGIMAHEINWYENQMLK